MTTSLTSLLTTALFATALGIPVPDRYPAAIDCMETDTSVAGGSGAIAASNSTLSLLTSSNKTANGPLASGAVANNPPLTTGDKDDGCETTEDDIVSTVAVSQGNEASRDGQPAVGRRHAGHGERERPRIGKGRGGRGQGNSAGDGIPAPAVPASANPAPADSAPVEPVPVDSDQAAGGVTGVQGQDAGARGAAIDAKAASQQRDELATRDLDPNCEVESLESDARSGGFIRSNNSDVSLGGGVNYK